MVWLGWIQLGRGLKLRFEVVWRLIAKRRVASFGIVVGHMAADFELGLGQSGEAVAVEQFGCEAASKGFGVGVVVAVATPAHALQRAVLCDQIFEAGGRVLAALVGMHDKPGRWPAHGQGVAQGLIDQVLGHRVAHFPAEHFARAAVKLDGQVQPAAALAQ